MVKIQRLFAKTNLKILVYLLSVRRLAGRFLYGLKEVIPMICVYPADCTDFSGNGLGAVTPMSCTVTETLNGEWELTLVHDIDERGKWTRLSEGCILRAPVPAAKTPRVDLVTQQYQTSTYDVQIYKITTKSGPLHLRSGTGTNYRILGKYKKGREIIVLNKTTSSWYEVTAPDGKHGYLYPSLYLLPTYNSTTNRTVFEGSYIGASSFSSWEDSTGNNRRMLEVRNAAYQASLDFAVLLRTCTGGTWASYRLFHAGMATPIPLANGGTGASSAKSALSNLGIFYSTSLPSGGTDGQICLVPV